MPDKDSLKTQSKKLPSPPQARLGVLLPIDTENSAKNKSKKPAAKHYSAKATMEFNWNLVQVGKKKRKKKKSLI